MALKDGDKLEIQRFVTSEGFKYFFMSGLGKFTELEFYQSECFIKQLSLLRKWLVL
jgi:hypothetical protein